MIFRKIIAISLVICGFTIPLNAQKIVQYYYYGESLVYRWERDSIVNHSGYFYSYHNVLINEHTYKNEDTIVNCYRCPLLFADSICQKYEIISIRKNPLKKYDRKWQRKKFRHNFYMIDIADTLHINYFTIVSFKKPNSKKRVAEIIQVGNIYDLVLYNVNYPAISQPYDWGCTTTLELSFDRHKIHAYHLVMSPNINGPYYIPEF